MSLSASNLASSPNTPEAILFDMDGVLVDSEALHWETVGDVLRVHLGSDAPQLPPRVGWSDDELWPELRARFSLRPSVRSLILERDKWAQERLVSAPPPVIEGALSAIQRWRSTAPKLPLAVVSASPRTQMELSLRAFIHDEGGSLFDAVISGVDDAPQNKPHPTPYQVAAAKLGVTLTRCWIAEDSTTGLTSGLASGASVFAINAQHADPALLTRCQLHLNNLGDLYNEWEMRNSK